MSVAEALYQGYLKNTKYLANAEVVSRIYIKLAQLSFLRRDLNALMYYYDKACEYSCSAQIRIVQAEALLSAGLLNDSLIYTRKAREILNKGIEKWEKPYLAQRLQKLEQVLY